MDKKIDGTYTVTLNKRKDYFCTECGAPAYVTKEKPHFDSETGKVAGYFLWLRCTAHRFRHSYQRSYERIENVK